MTNIIRLKTNGRDLSTELARSIETIEEYGTEWCTLAARADAEFPGADLRHPSKLPGQEELAAVHAQLDGLINDGIH